MRSARDRLTALLLPFALAAAPVAAATPPANTPTAHAAPVWTVDKPASRLSFRATMDGKAFDGVFKRWDAQLAFDPAQLPSSRLQVVVETASAVTGDPARDALLPSPVWLSAGRFPRATFTSRVIKPIGAGRYRVSGVLTLRGVSRPLDAQVEIAVTHDRLLLSGALPLDRHAFAIGPAGADAASPAVQVQARLAARRAR